MATSGKKGKKKGQTMNIEEFTQMNINWATEMSQVDDTTADEDYKSPYARPAVDRRELPTGPMSTRVNTFDSSKLPQHPPFNVYIGNLPYDTPENVIYDFFEGIQIKSLRARHGYAYAEFEDIESLKKALLLNQKMMGKRALKIDLPEHHSNTERDNKTEDNNLSSDWRAASQPVSSDRLYGSGGRQDRYGDRNDRFGDRNDRFGGDRNDRFGDRNDRFGGDRNQRSYGGGWASRDGPREDRSYGDDRNRGYNNRERPYNRNISHEREEGSTSEASGPPPERKKLNLKKRTVPLEQPVTPTDKSEQTSSIFGNAKPVDTAVKEKEIEERLQKQKLEDTSRREIERGRDFPRHERRGSDRADGFRPRDYYDRDTRSRDYGERRQDDNYRRSDDYRTDNQYYNREPSSRDDYDRKNEYDSYRDGYDRQAENDSYRRESDSYDRRGSSQYDRGNDYNSGVSRGTSREYDRPTQDNNAPRNERRDSRDYETRDNREADVSSSRSDYRDTKYDNRDGYNRDDYTDDRYSHDRRERQYSDSRDVDRDDRPVNRNTDDLIDERNDYSKGARGNDRVEDTYEEIDSPPPVNIWEKRSLEKQLELKQKEDSRYVSADRRDTESNYRDRNSLDDRHDKLDNYSIDESQDKVNGDKLSRDDSLQENVDDSHIEVDDRQLFQETHHNREERLHDHDERTDDDSYTRQSDQIEERLGNDKQSTHHVDERYGKSERRDDRYPDRQNDRNYNRSSGALENKRDDRTYNRRNDDRRSEDSQGDRRPVPAHRDDRPPQRRDDRRTTDRDSDRHGDDRRDPAGNYRRGHDGYRRDGPSRSGSGTNIQNTDDRKSPREEKVPDDKLQKSPSATSQKKETFEDAPPPTENVWQRRKEAAQAVVSVSETMKDDSDEPSSPMKTLQSNSPKAEPAKGSRKRGQAPQQRGQPQSNNRLDESKKQSQPNKSHQTAVSHQVKTVQKAEPETIQEQPPPNVWKIREKNREQAARENTKRDFKETKDVQSRDGKVHAKDTKSGDSKTEIKDEVSKENLKEQATELVKEKTQDSSKANLDTTKVHVDKSQENPKPEGTKSKSRKRGGKGKGDSSKEEQKSKEKPLPKSIEEMPKVEESTNQAWSHQNKFSFLSEDDKSAES